MTVKYSFADAFWIVREAAANDPGLYGHKFVLFVLSKMTLCEDGVLVDLGDGEWQFDSRVLH